MKNCYPFNVELHLNAYSPSYDRSLLWTVFGLILFGVIMVTSASMGLNDDDPFYYTYREVLQLGLATACFVFMLYIPMSVVQRNANYFLLFTLILLIIVLFIGSSIKGASRWIPLGVFNFQPAELAKLALFCYLASYLTRKSDEVKRIKTFLIPILVMGILALLLLLQPDLGTVIVLFTVTLAILFIAGAKLWQFIAILLSGLTVVGLLIIFEPYRMRRLTGFMDPWADPTGSGYQLTHSLMAIGNGGLWGEGLGNSVEKLGYLPEAHTDFIFAIIAEELGYIGVLFLLLLLFFLSFKAIAIGYRAISAEQKFSGYLACQIGIWFGFQTFVNVGVTSGLLPTKGLTLPFISYGGSSLIIMAIAVALLLRIDFEYRQQQLQAKVRRK